MMMHVVVSRNVSWSKDLTCVLMETLACRLPQFGRKMEVVISRNDRHVAQVGGQMLQFALHIDPLSIPAIQCCHGKSVTQIMQARGSASLVQDAGRQAQ